jgi:hypothetical protein
MERRTDAELREHPIFRQLVTEVKAWPRERQHKLIEDLEERQAEDGITGTKGSDGETLS